MQLELKLKEEILSRQQKLILDLLKSKDIVPLPEIRALGIAMHTSRIHELRKKGYNIENIIKWTDSKGGYKEKHSWYKLIK